MKQNAYIAGVGMTPFGKHPELTLKALTAEAIREALADASLGKEALQAAWMGNTAAGVIVGQVCVPGQMALRSLGIERIPVVNVENACASAATAFHEACAWVSAGHYDVVLASGAEKLVTEDKARSFAVFTGGLDVEAYAEVAKELQDMVQSCGAESKDGAGKNRSVFMDMYAAGALLHMKHYGTTQRQLALVAAKNSRHGALNPKAQFREANTVEEILAAREIAYPLTLPMCAPVGDGAAAAVIVSERKAREIGLDRCVRVRSTALVSGWDHEFGDEDTVETAAAEAYRDAEVGPQDLDVVELHDAAAPSEIMHTESLGLCDRGRGGELVESGDTEIGGRIPVNPSGGLLRKGHPIGATGLAQIYELSQQLRGKAGARQVEGARVALAENGGGYIRGDAAAMVVSILSR